MAERIQKFLAAAGFASRREVEQWIRAGRLTVDGRLAELGQQVSGDELFSLDDKALKLRHQTSPHAWLVYHKPEGEVCTRRDPEGRPTVFQALPKGQRRWISVGRLDVNSSGLLIFTSDGELAHRLMHPRSGIKRQYAVRVLGQVSARSLSKLLGGISFPDGIARFESVDAAGGDGANTWYHVQVSEGRNRIVRRMWEAVGHQVSRLIRISYGPVRLPPGLRQGQWRMLDMGKVNALYTSVEMLMPSDNATSRPRKPIRSKR